MKKIKKRLWIAISLVFLFSVYIFVGSMEQGLITPTAALTLGGTSGVSACWAVHMANRIGG
jgi:hypothetical protein